jgi:two-component system chemotaxis response regulator CheB
MAKTRVLVVDDSALVRTMLASFINAQPDLECVGAASDPYVAREMIRNLNPDVLTLDVEMPRMDGIDFLEKLMRLRPMPVVMVSTLTERGADVTLRALELGAVDFVAKPRIGVSQGLLEAAGDIVGKIRIASRARIGRRFVATPAVASASEPSSRTQPAQPSRSEVAAVAVVAARAPGNVLRRGTEKLVAIGASTGGTEALRAILIRLPADFPAIVITQHMPPGFTRSFAERLDSQCRIRVKEAADGERLVPGHAYIAPGGRHLRVDRSGANYVAVVDDSAPVNRHKPSVDVLFASVASCVGPNAIGVMLTGMGRDGADSMRAMRDAGAYNLSQDEASCVVYGMPREAVAAGAVHETVALDEIASRLLEHLGGTGAVTGRI